MDAKKILDKVRNTGAKTRFTVSVDEKVFETFKAICGEKAISPVIEEMLKEFIFSAEEEPTGTLSRPSKKSK